MQLQLSRWGGDEFYINLGVYIKRFGEMSCPAAPQCHIRNRVDADSFQNLTPCEFEFKDKSDAVVLHQSEKVAELLRDKGLTWLEALSTESDIKRLCKPDPPLIQGGWPRDEVLEWARTELRD